MRLLFERIRRWTRRPSAARPSFDVLLRAAYDEPLMMLSAQALIRSLSSPPECGPELNCDDRRQLESIRFEQQLSTNEAR